MKTKGETRRGRIVTREIRVDGAASPLLCL